MKRFWLWATFLVLLPSMMTEGLHEEDGKVGPPKLWKPAETSTPLSKQLEAMKAVKGGLQRLLELYGTITNPKNGVKKQIRDTVVSLVRLVNPDLGKNNLQQKKLMPFRTRRAMAATSKIGGPNFKEPQKIIKQLNDMLPKRFQKSQNIKSKTLNDDLKKKDRIHPILNTKESKSNKKGMVPTKKDDKIKQEVSEKLNKKPTKPTNDKDKLKTSLKSEKNQDRRMPPKMKRESEKSLKKTDFRDKATEKPSISKKKDPFAEFLKKPKSSYKKKQDSVIDQLKTPSKTSNEKEKDPFEEYLKTPKSSKKKKDPLDEYIKSLKAHKKKVDPLDEYLNTLKVSKDQIPELLGKGKPKTPQTRSENPITATMSLKVEKSKEDRKRQKKRPRDRYYGEEEDYEDYPEEYYPAPYRKPRRFRGKRPGNAFAEPDNPGETAVAVSAGRGASVAVSAVRRSAKTKTPPNESLLTKKEMELLHALSTVDPKRLMSVLRYLSDKDNGKTVKKSTKKTKKTAQKPKKILKDGTKKKAKPLKRDDKKDSGSTSVAVSAGNGTASVAVSAGEGKDKVTVPPLPGFDNLGKIDQTTTTVKPK